MLNFEKQNEITYLNSVEPRASWKRGNTKKDYFLSLNDMYNNAMQHKK